MILDMVFLLARHDIHCTNPTGLDEASNRHHVDLSPQMTLYRSTPRINEEIKVSRSERATHALCICLRLNMV